jgi:hypothetical protein
MQAEDPDARVPSEGHSRLQVTEQRLAALIRTEVRQLSARPTWADLRGLASHLSWSYDKTKKLSARNLIPGKVKHGQKVTFHLPTVDTWLQADHAQQLLSVLPHEEWQLGRARTTGRPIVSRLERNQEQRTPRRGRKATTMAGTRNGPRRKSAKGHSGVYYRIAANGKRTYEVTYLRLDRQASLVCGRGRP